MAHSEFDLKFNQLLKSFEDMQLWNKRQDEGNWDRFKRWGYYLHNILSLFYLNENLANQFIIAYL